MNGRDFLTLAYALLANQSEAAWRSAISSRAYYATFHGARDLWEAWGFAVPRGERAHAYLWLRLSNCGNPQLAQTGAALNSARQARNEADYDLRRPCTNAIATKTVGVLDQTLQALGGAGTLPGRTQMIDAIRTYERDVLREVTWHP